MPQRALVDAEPLGERLAQVLGQHLRCPAEDELMQVGGVAPDRERSALEVGLALLQQLQQAGADGIELTGLLAAKRYVSVDSITDLTRQAMAWAKTRPEAFSERSGKPDTRGAYGLLARETIGLLKHLQLHPERR